MTRMVLIFLLLICSTVAAAAGKNSAVEGVPVREAKVFTTQHEMKLAGKTINYTATAGTMQMKNEQGKPVALMGYTAYVANGKQSANRPLMFAYNGGPGSASIWLHMGILGPRRAIATDAGFS